MRVGEKDRELDLSSAYVLEINEFPKSQFCLPDIPDTKVQQTAVENQYVSVFKTQNHPCHLCFPFPKLTFPMLKEHKI